MTTEIQGFVIPIEARIDRLERSLKKASQAQQRFATDASRRSRQSADAMVRHYDTAGQKISNSFKTLVLPKLAAFAGAAAGIGVAGAAAAVRGQIRALATLGDEAKRAGMSVETFQEWRFVADQNRIGVDALVDSFKELSLRADEFIVTGKGSAAEAFERLGFTSEDLARKLKDPSALMVEIIGKLEKLDQAARIRITDELFGGTGGEQFVQIIDQGAQGLQRTIERARDLGVVLDEQAIQKAQELDRKFSEVTARVDTMYKRVVVGAFEAAEEWARLREENEALVTAFEALVPGGRVIGSTISAVFDESSEAAHGLEKQASDTFETMMTGAKGLASDLQGVALQLLLIDDSADITGVQALAGEVQTLIQRYRDGTITADEFRVEIARLNSEAGTAVTEISKIDGVSLDRIVGRINGISTAIRAAITLAQSLRGALPGGDVPQGDAGPEWTPVSIPGRGSRPPPAAPAELGIPDLPRGGAGGGRTQSDYDRAVESLRQETAALEAEAVALVAASGAGREYADAIEFARTRAELLNAAQREGRQITPELTAQVDRLAEAHLSAGNAAKKAADDLKSIEERGKKGAEALSDVFVSVLDGSKSAEEAVADLLMQIAKIQFQKAFVGMFGGTGAANMLGGLLGFSSGGFTGHGGTFEPKGIVHGGEFVISKRATQRIGIGNLEALHRGALRGYSGGGLVGGIPKAAEGLKGSKEKLTAPSITISAPITVNGSAGTPEQNNDLAKQVARESETMFRGLIRDEMTRQMRPGGMLR